MILLPVIDSSPLIYLGKTKSLFILREMYGNVKCSPAVYREVVEIGEKKGFIDAKVVKREIGNIVIVHHPSEKAIDKVKRDLRNRGIHLGRGEIEGIALCIDLNDNLFISDDDDAKMYAEIFGINGKGTIYLLLKACKDGIISKDECIKTFNKMIKEGFWISPEVINLFYEKIKSF